MSEDNGVVLEPCPFCGSHMDSPIESVVQLVHNEWHPEHNPEGDWWTVQCDNCTATMGQFRSPDEAEEAWDTRALARQSTDLDQDAVAPPKWTSATPMVRTKRKTWSKVHYAEDGGIGPDIAWDEADVIGAWQFHMIKAGSPTAAAILKQLSTPPQPQGEGE